MLLRNIIGLALCCSLLLGCPASTPVQNTQQSEGDTVEVRRLRDQVSDLERQLAATEAELRKEREDRASADLRRIDAETRLAQAERRFQSLQRAHAEAIAEVVRTQAKLRGSVGQADAASNIAEAEIALSSAENLSDAEREDIRKALAAASEEFDLENYGGALYLSSEAKRKISEVRRRGGRGPGLAPIADEVPFSNPVAMVLSSNANVRGGPGLDNDVVATLPSGTELEGYSYLGSWVRVRIDEESSGWIYNTLIRPKNDG